MEDKGDINLPPAAPTCMNTHVSGDARGKTQCVDAVSIYARILEADLVLQKEHCTPLEVKEESGNKSIRTFFKDENDAVSSVRPP